MRFILKTIMPILNRIDHHGWLIIVSMFYPVYWIQDSNGENNGYDLLSLKRDRSYARMTYWTAVGKHPYR